VNLVEQWREIEAGLPRNWSEASLTLTVNDANSAHAAALLGPLQPVRSGTTIRLFPLRRSAEAVRRLLGGLDREGIAGTLQLASARESEQAAAFPQRESLAASWRELVDDLPMDWSDLYVELELDSTDYLEPAALRLAPVNPARYGDEPTFRFRAARRFGYGAASEMTRRCLERLDEAGITGQVRILRALSDTKPVATQGPVWYVAGKSV
jgi:hypothetical protein